MKKNKLVYGWGINDADYCVCQTGTDGRQIMCPIYSKWKHMIQRCYSAKHQVQHPTYKDCSVCEEWKYFSNFRKWMIEQDWEGKQLDKDLLFFGNRVYSPETCVFISRELNCFTNDNVSFRGE